MRLRGLLTRKRTLGILLAVSAASSLLGHGPTGPVRRAATFLLAPLADPPMYAVTYLKSRIAAAGREDLTVEQARRLQEETQYLRRLVVQLQHEGESYRQQAESLANFQRLYGPVKDLACELIPARVVAAGSLPYDQARTVSFSARQAGRVSGGEPVTTAAPSEPVDRLCGSLLLATDRSKALPPQLAVVTANSLVGRVTEAGAFTARVRLVTDRQSRLRGRIRRVIDPQRPRMISVTEGATPQRTQLTPANNRPIDVIAQGDGAGGLVVEHVKEYHAVRVNDLLVTAGEEEGLPTEIHVGRVVAVKPDPKDQHRVTLQVAPHADLEGLRDVFILLPLAPPIGGG